MGHLIEKGEDSPGLPRLSWDVPLFRNGRLIGVERRIPKPESPGKGYSDRRVLVINDVRDMAALTSELLGLWGFQVTAAYSGAEGLAAARALVPDLILLNCPMPDLDGLEVLQILRREPSTAGVKTILTGIDPIGELACWRGADDFILLPFTPAGLLAKIARVFSA